MVTSAATDAGRAAETSGEAEAGEETAWLIRRLYVPRELWRYKPSALILISRQASATKTTF